MSATPTVVFLVDFTGFERALQFPGSATVNGEVFPHSVTVCDCNGSEVQAELGNSFSTLAGFVGVPDSEGEGTVVNVLIVGEDGVLFEDVVRWGESAHSFSVNVSGVLRLHLRVVEVSRPSFQSVSGVFADVTLE